MVDGNVVHLERGAGSAGSAGKALSMGSAGQVNSFRVAENGDCMSIIGLMLPEGALFFCRGDGEEE